MVSWRNGSISGDDIADFFLGEDPRQVEGPTGLAETAERRRTLGEMLAAQARGDQPSPAEQAIGIEAAMQADALARRQQSMASGQRGFGAIGANRAAAGNVAQAQQGLAGGVAAAMGQQRAADIARGQAGLAQVLSDEERAAYELAQFQMATAKPGLLPALGTLGGAMAGGVLGKGDPRAIQAGGSLGGAVGGAFQRTY